MNIKILNKYSNINVILYKHLYSMWEIRSFTFSFILMMFDLNVPYKVVGEYITSCYKSI